MLDREERHGVKDANDGAFVKVATTRAWWIQKSPKLESANAVTLKFTVISFAMKTMSGSTFFIFA
jgi:hypothetical protein